MSALELILVLAGLWVGVVLLVRLVLVPRLRCGPGRDPIRGLLWHGNRVYCRLLHRLRARGQDQVRRTIEPGGLIVVANHTSGVDPLLIQACCRFHIRWLMAADMMIQELDWLWTKQNIIPVARDGSDSRPVREAIRHVKGGGVVGIFPEGRIVTRGEIRPFHRGIGVVVAKTRAPVLLVWISGTPETDDLTEAFYTPSRSRVEFFDLMDFGECRDPEAITQRLRERLAEASGWPLNDEPMPAESTGRGRPWTPNLPSLATLTRLRRPSRTDRAAREAGPTPAVRFEPARALRNTA